MTDHCILVESAYVCEVDFNSLSLSCCKNIGNAFWSVTKISQVYVTYNNFQCIFKAKMIANEFLLQGFICL